MKPYYEDGLTTIYHGDARDILPVLQADVIVADPPYSQTSLEWDKWPEGWPQCARQALTNRGSMWCFGSLRMFMTHVADFLGWALAQDIVWEKQNGSNFHNDRFRRVHESIAQFYSKSTKWADVYRSPVFTLDAIRRTVRRKKRPPHMGNIEAGNYISYDGGPRLMRSVQFVKSAHGYAVHPTQKPVGIILPLLKYSCPTDGIVVDLFAGSCSTLVAARQLGLRGIGIEIDRKWIDFGIKRLSLPFMQQPDNSIG